MTDSGTCGVRAALLLALALVAVACGQGTGAGRPDRSADGRGPGPPVAEAPLDLSGGAATLPVPVSARRSPALVVTDRRVLVLGGQERDGTEARGLTDGVVYDLDRQGWWALPDLPVALAAPAGLWSAAAVVVGTACTREVWVEAEEVSRCRPGGLRAFRWAPDAPQWEQLRLSSLPEELRRLPQVPWAFRPVGRVDGWAVFAHAGDVTPPITSVGDGMVLWLLDPQTGASRWVAVPPGWGVCGRGRDLLAHPGGYPGGPVPPDALAQPLRLQRLDPDRMAWLPVAGSETPRPLTGDVTAEALRCSDDGQLAYEAVRAAEGRHAILLWEPDRGAWRRLPDLVGLDAATPAAPPVEHDGTLAVYDPGRASWFVLTPAADGWAEREGPPPPGAGLGARGAAGVGRSGSLRVALIEAHGDRPLELLVSDVARIVGGLGPDAPAPPG